LYSPEGHTPNNTIHLIHTVINGKSKELTKNGISLIIIIVISLKMKLDLSFGLRLNLSSRA